MSIEGMSIEGMSTEQLRLTQLNTERALTAQRGGLVAAVLALDSVASHYQVRMTPAAALLFARKLPAYNQLEPGVLAGVIQQIDQAIPLKDFGQVNGTPNPNNFIPHHCYDIGSENSRVLYLDWPKAYAPDGFDFLALEETLMGIAHAAQADEFETIESSGRGFRYRIWWD